jgi:predicted phosphate transport protein (TIGR00153 family)
MIVERGDRVMKIFKDRNKQLELEIELYLNCLQKGANTFLEGVKAYLRDEDEHFIERIQMITEEEKEADEHLVNIKYVLFRYNLIPDLSADILELMDSMDDINDISKEILLDLQIIKPKIDPTLVDDFGHIAKKSKKAAETLIKAVRIYFTEFKTIEDFITKVNLFESEADMLLYELKVKIFDDKLTDSLSEKMVLSNFAADFAKLSDLAETIASKLSVFRFKRSI